MHRFPPSLHHFRRLRIADRPCYDFLCQRCLYRAFQEMRAVDTHFQNEEEEEDEISPMQSWAPARPATPSACPSEDDPMSAQCSRLADMEFKAAGDVAPPWTPKRRVKLLGSPLKAARHEEGEPELTSKDLLAL